MVVDVRQEQQIAEAVAKGGVESAGIDILINNASVISTTGVLERPIKRYDVIMDINVRGTFVCSQCCLPHLKRAKNPHILTLSPPIDLNPKWFAKHAAYTKLRRQSGHRQRVCSK